MATVFQIDKAMDALKRLLDGRDRGAFSDTEFFHCVAERGPLFRVEIEQGTAVSAGDIVKRYECGGPLTEFLATIAARHREIVVADDQ